MSTAYTASQSGDWDTASTWGGAGVPDFTLGDTVSIIGNYVVTKTGNLTVANSGSITIRNVTMATLTVTGNLTIAADGTLTLGGVGGSSTNKATLGVTGVCTIQGSLSQTSGAAGAIHVMSLGSTVFDGGSLALNQYSTVAGSLSLGNVTKTANGGSITYSSVCCTLGGLKGVCTFPSLPSGGYNAVFSFVDDGSMASPAPISYWTPQVAAGKTLTIRNASGSLPSIATGYGNLTLGAGANLILGTGNTLTIGGSSAWTVGAGATITNNGTLTIGGSGTIGALSVTNNGTLTHSSGTISGSVTNNAGHTWNQSGMASFTGPLFANYGTYTSTGGTVSGSTTSFQNFGTATLAGTVSCKVQTVTMESLAIGSITTGAYFSLKSLRVPKAGGGFIDTTGMYGLRRNQL
jgi:hypothetical protein